MRISQKTVLVTGSEGFIGSHTVEKLVSEGAKVRCFVKYNFQSNIGNLNFLDKEILKQIEIFFGDVNDYSSLIAVTKDVDIVIHLAALVSIPYSYINPNENFMTNTMGTLNLANACRLNKVKKIIHISTSEVYGSAQYIPMDEKHPLVAQSPYSASKIGADKVIESYCHAFSFPAVTIRPFNTFGPRQTGRAIIPTIIAQALNKDKIKLGNLKPSRDFTYVLDTVDAIILAVKKENIIGETINLGTGVDISIGELANKIVKIIDPNLKITQDKSRYRPSKSEVDQLKSDNRLAKKLLGWEPKYDLDFGLKETISWLKKNPEFIDHENYAR